ncbi:MAG: hypothetical protein HDS65_04130 [Bacteroidales bacterium]|nr:hypothetical protein [Bacteroidales bacterium]
MNYNKIMNLLAKGDKWQFDIPVAEQLEFIRRLPEPKHDISRSFYQYKAQMLFVSRWKRLVFNFIALFVLPLYILVAFIKRIRSRYRYKVEAILEKSGHQGVVPDSVAKKYKISTEEWSSGFSLSFRDLGFVLRLSPYLIRSPYFVFKILYKVGLYSQLIKLYRPDAIIVYNEYSYTSSALTYFCESNGVEHINVMHGEKLYYVRDSFFRFSKTYVWEDYYIKLLSDLRAPREQFVAELPPFMSVNPSEHRNSDAYADYKYYLAKYTEEELQSIVKSLEFISRQGASLKYRPHPRYSDIQLLKKYVDESMIEYQREVDIETSISNLKYAVGVYTTVLNQCYHAGVNVVIDDMNFPENFTRLSELGYVLLSKDVVYLSQLQ